MTKSWAVFDEIPLWNTEPALWVTEHFHHVEGRTEITVTVPDHYTVGSRLPQHPEFNPRGGISIDFGGAWDDNTFEPHPEGVAAYLMRLAFICAMKEYEARKARGDYEAGV